jgi:hypothetical protein
LGDKSVSRLDSYLAFVQLCLDAAEPGGFVCLVLPQAFLNADNAGPFRAAIPDEFDIRCLVDLSAVPVFEGVGTYSILLVLQRRIGSGAPAALAHVAQITEFVGAALQACLDGRSVETPYHRVFAVPQSFFRNKNWAIVSPTHLAISERLAQLPKLSQFMQALQGFVTGADDVFIRPRADVPKGEESIYLSYLPDRLIMRYRVPTRVDDVVFYPYEGETALTESVLTSKYPKTWRYLRDNRTKLEARGPVRAGKTPWWRPERPRNPDRIRRPKIVCPHLMLTPRFAIDGRGQFAVSHGPFMIAIDPAEEEVLLKFFAAVLNSSVSGWFLRNYAPKYSHGYNRLEPSLLRTLPVPDVTSLDTAATNRVVAAVEKLQSGRGSASIDAQVDHLVAEIYGFTAQQRKRLLGLE